MSVSPACQGRSRMSRSAPFGCGPADGSVHIVPFSAVTTITNSSRGAGNAAVSVNVSYKEDTDRAGQILKDIVAEMRREPEYRQAIRGDLELWGVDKVDGSMASIVGQIRCTDSGRWPVQREFNRRMKRRFQECGIDTDAGRDAVDAAARLTGVACSGRRRRVVLTPRCRRQVGGSIRITTVARKPITGEQLYF